MTLRSEFNNSSYRGLVLVQIVVVVVPVHLRVLALVLRSLVCLAPRIRWETYGAVRQGLGTADNWVHSEGAESIRQRLRDC